MREADFLFHSSRSPGAKMQRMGPDQIVQPNFHKRFFNALSAKEPAAAVYTEQSNAPFIPLEKVKANANVSNSTRTLLQQAPFGIRRSIAKRGQPLRWWLTNLLPEPPRPVTMD